MDKVRLGRALGYGTRHAARTLVAVAEAAAAPDPPRSNAASTPEASDPPVAPATRPAAGSGPQPGPRRAQVRRAGRSFWTPLATFSSALWLRVTGLFFALLAAVMANGAWRLRGTLSAGASAPRHFWMFVGFAVLFGYFAVTGFVRARARERRTAGKPR